MGGGGTTFYWVSLFPVLSLSVVHYVFPARSLHWEFLTWGPWKLGWGVGGSASPLELCAEIFICLHAKVYTAYSIFLKGNMAPKTLRLHLYFSSVHPDNYSTWSGKVGCIQQIIRLERSRKQSCGGFWATLPRSPFPEGPFAPAAGPVLLVESLQFTASSRVAPAAENPLTLASPHPGTDRWRAILAPEHTMEWLPLWMGLRCRNFSLYPILMSPPLPSVVDPKGISE